MVQYQLLLSIVSDESLAFDAYLQRIPIKRMQEVHLPVSLQFSSF